MRRLSRSSMDDDGDHTHLDSHTIEERLKAGKPVVFRLKYEGSFLVNDSRGVAPVRAAFKELKVTKEERRKRGIRHSPVKDFVITLNGVSIRDPVSKEEELFYGIRSISYIVNDEKNRNYIGMIAQVKGKLQFECTILKQEEGRAREVVHTLGSAFDGAYEESISKSRSNSESKPTESKPTESKPTESKPTAAITPQPTDEISILRSRLRDLAVLVPEDKLSTYLRKQNITEITEIPGATTEKKSDTSTPNKRPSPTVGRRLENLVWDDSVILEGNSEYKDSIITRNRSQSDIQYPRVNPPPRIPPRRPLSRPLSTISIEDPFEMGDFNGVSFPEFEGFSESTVAGQNDSKLAEVKFDQQTALNDWLF